MLVLPRFYPFPGNKPYLILYANVIIYSEAGCTPFAASILGDYFPQNIRATALGIYNWGIYVGYSMSFAVGNFITDANILGQVCSS